MRFTPIIRSRARKMTTTADTPTRIFLLSVTRPKGLAFKNVRVVTSSRQVANAVAGAPLRALWVAFSSSLLGALVQQLVGTTARHWLLDLEPHPRHDFNTLRGIFGE